MKQITFVILVGILMAILSGCAAFGGDGMKLNIETPDKTIAFKTDYQIENGLKLVRTEGGEYDIELGSATTKDAEMGFMVEMMRMMVTMMATMNGMPATMAQPPANTE